MKRRIEQNSSHRHRQTAGGGQLGGQTVIRIRSSNPELLRASIITNSKKYVDKLTKYAHIVSIVLAEVI